jgi:hypothetical protein
MTTSAINRLRPRYPATATVFVGVLLALALTNSAQARPTTEDHATGSDRAVHARGHYVGHACFNTPLTWSEALEGALPRCYTYVY